MPISNQKAVRLAPGRLDPRFQRPAGRRRDLELDRPLGLLLKLPLLPPIPAVRVRPPPQLAGTAFAVAAHAMRVAETAHWLEWQDWIDPLLQRPYRVTDGQLHVPDLPGVGLEWNEDAVARCRVDR